MAATPASGGECSITVPTALPDAAGGGELRRERTIEEIEERRERAIEEWMERARRRQRRFEWRRGEGTIEEHRIVRWAKKLKSLNKIVFCVALLEWVGNAVGTLAMLWATLILLGGFRSLLTRMDFWFSTVMIFMEATRIFIRNDAFVDQWLFGSTRAFRWGIFTFPRILEAPEEANEFAVFVGACINLVPVFRPEIAVGILKVALLVISTHLLIRLPRDRAKYFNFAFIAAAATCGIFVFSRFRVRDIRAAFYTYLGVWLLVMWLRQTLSRWIFHKLPMLKDPETLLKLKGGIALALACLPFQAIFARHYRSISVAIAVPLLILSSTPEDLEEDSSCVFFLQIGDIILTVLFFWTMMFPLPGISLRLSFYILFPALAAVLIGNLQVPVAFLQVVLSILRLRSLIGHHHNEYRPLPQDATSPNLVPSIVVFFMLELCQGSSYILAIILGLFSLPSRRSLVRELGFPEKWGAKAVDLYYHQAYQARTEKGLLPLEKYTPSLESFAVESLGCTSSEMQLAGLRILNDFLVRWNYESKEKLIKQITFTSKKAVMFNLIDMLGSTVVGEEDRLLAASVIDKLSGSLKISEFPGMVKLISSLLDASLPNRVSENNGGNVESILLGMSILESLACDPDNRAEIVKEGIDGGKIGTPFLLNSLERILDSEDCQEEDCQEELWERAMDIIAKLALDEAAREEIGSTKAILGKLLRAFLRPDNVVNRREDISLRKAAGEALANLTMMSTDNCWAILLADTEHNLAKNLINMLEHEYYICVAANLLHNLCANSSDKLIELGANVHLESALQKVMQIIRTKEGKQLEAALCVTSQIGYAIPGYFAQMLESETDAAAAELVEKLLDTLKSNREPCLEYPRTRRVLVEVVISIVDLCPGYIKIFREKGAKDALDIVKGTPSRLEKYRVFLDGKGAVVESLPMRDLVDKAKMLIHQATPTLGSQPGNHA